MNMSMSMQASPQKLILHQLSQHFLGNVRSILSAPDLAKTHDLSSDERRELIEELNTATHDGSLLREFNLTLPQTKQAEGFMDGLINFLKSVLIPTEELPATA